MMLIPSPGQLTPAPQPLGQRCLERNPESSDCEVHLTSLTAHVLRGLLEIRDRLPRVADQERQVELNPRRQERVDLSVEGVYVDVASQGDLERIRGGLEPGQHRSAAG
jgi:hypothetical protein